MITFCTKCGINWAALWGEDAGDEHYEFCPECKTDMFLQPGNDIVAYIKSPISGQVIQCGLMMVKPEPIKPVKPKIRIKVGVPTQNRFERQDEQILKALEAYQSSGDENDFFSNLKYK